MSEDHEIRELLQRVKRIAVLGMKAEPHEDAFRVPRYLQERGYAVRPVNPKLERVLGEPAVACLAELNETPELINVFRARQHLAGHAQEVLAMDPLPLAVWFQLGIRDDTVAEQLRNAGVQVVQDRCLMVEHGRLLGSDT